MSTGRADIGIGVVGVLMTTAHRAIRKRAPAVDATALLWSLAQGSATMRRVAVRLRTDAGWPPPAPGTDTAAGNVDGADTVAQLLREVRWTQLTTCRGDLRWDGSVAAAVRAALDEARAAGVAYAGDIHLMAGVLRDPAGILAGLRVDRDELIGMLRADPAWRASDRPHTPLVSHLRMGRELDERAGLRGGSTAGTGAATAPTGMAARFR